MGDSGARQKDPDGQDQADQEGAQARFNGTEPFGQLCKHPDSDAFPGKVSEQGAGPEDETGSAEEGCPDYVPYWHGAHVAQDFGGSVAWCGVSCLPATARRMLEPHNP